MASVASRATPRIPLDRNRTFHALLSVGVHWTIDLVFPSLEAHFELGTLAGVQIMSLLFDRFAFDLKSVGSVAPVLGLEHVGSSFVQVDLVRGQLVFGLLDLDGLDDRTRSGVGSLGAGGRIGCTTSATSNGS